MYNVYYYYQRVFVCVSVSVGKRVDRVLYTLTLVAPRVGRWRFSLSLPLCIFLSAFVRRTLIKGFFWVFIFCFCSRSFYTFGLSYLYPFSLSLSLFVPFLCLLTAFVHFVLLLIFFLYYYFSSFFFQRSLKWAWVLCMKDGVLNPVMPAKYRCSYDV